MTPGKLYISLTVTPERLRAAFFREVIDSLHRQQHPFDGIVVNVPFVYKRTNEAYQVPEWLAKDARVRINRCEDLGPATKLLGFYGQLAPEDSLCVVDDDVIYLPDMLSNLVSRQQQQDALICTAPDLQGAPTGYSGYLLRRGLLDFDDRDIDDLLCNCFFTDDTWLGKVAGRKGVAVVGVSNDWLGSMDRARTDTHPQWFELCKNTDRDRMIRKCLGAGRFPLLDRLRRTLRRC